MSGMNFEMNVHRFFSVCTLFWFIKTGSGYNGCYDISVADLRFVSMDIVATSDVISLTTATSVSDCAVTCLIQDTCLAFFFHLSDHNCSLHSQHVDRLLNTSADGWIGFDLPDRVRPESTSFSISTSSFPSTTTTTTPLTSSVSTTSPSASTSITAGTPSTITTTSATSTSASTNASTPSTATTTSTTSTVMSASTNAGTPSTATTTSTTSTVMPTSTNAGTLSTATTTSTTSTVILTSTNAGTPSTATSTSANTTSTSTSTHEITTTVATTATDSTTVTTTPSTTAASTSTTTATTTERTSSTTAISQSSSTSPTSTTTSAATATSTDPTSVSTVTISTAVPATSSTVTVTVPTTSTTPTTTTVTSSTTTTPTTTAVFSLWVESVVDYSSEWRQIRWSAQKIIGENNVYPSYGDNDEAWASKFTTGIEWIIVQIATPLYITQIAIYETYHAGGVREVSVLNASGTWDVIWQTPGITDISSSRIFTPNITTPSYKVDQIRIEIDCSLAQDWVELDAVQVTGWT